MGRYRKLDQRVWSDEKFLTLSRSTPSGHVLWLYLLLGPHTTSLPGLFVAGEAGLAEALGWSLKGLRKASGELMSLGMVKADWQQRVVWIPNAVKYNPPENPKVVLSWRAHWESIPECQLKAEAHQRFMLIITSRGEEFRQAFIRTFGNGVAYRIANGMANQEQEQDNPPPPPQGGGTIFDKKPRMKHAYPFPQIPAILDTPEFRKTWQDWVCHREHCKAPLSARTAQKHFDVLAPEGVNGAIKLLEYALLQGYVSLKPDMVKT